MKCFILSIAYSRLIAAILSPRSRKSLISKNRSISFNENIRRLPEVRSGLLTLDPHNNESDVLLNRSISLLSQWKNRHGTSEFFFFHDDLLPTIIILKFLNCQPHLCQKMRHLDSVFFHFYFFNHSRTISTSELTSMATKESTERVQTPLQRHTKSYPSRNGQRNN